MMQQLTLEDFLEQKVEDWVEYTGCPFCDHLIVVDYPKKLFGQHITCPNCGREFVACHAVLADRSDFERSNLQ